VVAVPAVVAVAAVVQQPVQLPMPELLVELPPGCQLQLVLVAAVDLQRILEGLSTQLPGLVASEFALPAAVAPERLKPGLHWPYLSLAAVDVPPNLPRPSISLVLP